jgi:hypothetical protein
MQHTNSGAQPLGHAGALDEKEAIVSSIRSRMQIFENGLLLNLFFLAHPPLE